MKCDHIYREQIALGGRHYAVGVGGCEREALPGMTGCHEHVCREAMAMHIRNLSAELAAVKKPKPRKKR